MSFWLYVGWRVVHGDVVEICGDLVETCGDLVERSPPSFSSKTTGVESVESVETFCKQNKSIK
jgi:hypothetical protein